MVLSDISVKRPVLAIVMSAVIVVLGLFASSSLPIREYPDIDPPVISVSTAYPGAAPEVVSNEVTEPLERSLATVEGIASMESTSRDGNSQISLEFGIDRDLDSAASDIRDAVSRVQSQLPSDANSPQVTKSSSDSQPMIWISLTSQRYEADFLSDYADRFVVDRLSTINGVADVMVGGERRYAMRIWLDPVSMAATGVTVQDIEQALRANNVELPAGQIRTEARSLTVRTVTRLSTAEEFGDLVLREHEGAPLRLRDVARVERGVEDDSTQVRINGGTGVGIGVVRQSQSNTIEVADAVRAEVEAIGPTLPDGVTLEVAYDESIFVSSSIDAVIKVFIEALIIVVLVILAFLRSPRATLIPAVTIPVSLIGAFIAMAALGYSINVLTLLALLLAIGLVVDDAIVVLENIQRRVDEGEPALVAAVRGTREVGFAVLATSVTLISVFIPISFLDGSVGRLFAEFGIVMAAAVVFSTFVALTLAPMMASKWLKPNRKALARHQNAEGDRRDAEPGMQRYYRAAVTWAVDRPVSVIGVSLFGAAIVVLFFMAIPQELSPTEDRGIVIIPSIGPEGATPEFIDQGVRRVESVALPLVEEGLADSVFSVVGIGGNIGFTIVGLADWADRDVGQQEIIGRLMPGLLSIPEVQSFPIAPPGLGQGGFDQPVQYVLGGSDYEELEVHAQAMLERARENPALVNPRIDFERTRQQIEVSVNRDRAAALGISVDQIGRTLQVLLAATDVTSYIDGGQEYDVIMQAPRSLRAGLDDVGGFFIRTGDGDLVPLSSVVTMEEVGAAASLGRVDRLPAITLQAGLAPGYDMGSALSYLDQIAVEELPSDVRTSYLGQSQEFMDGSAQIYLTFGLAFLLVFLVLAAQFESFVHPTIILISTPLAVTGAMIALFFAGYSFNIYSQVGIILLIGLMAKNGILVVEFANQLRDRGQGVREASIDAAVLRLRPVLMTTLAQVFGAIPLVRAGGAGAESRGTIGLVIIGGMLFATAFTLFLTPVLYKLMAGYTRPTNWISERLKEQEAAADQPDQGNTHTEGRPGVVPAE
ncbi:efflux RND transporter permease subunit [Fodinicurvata sp. EGI_FJ10296]|uniref:efflux RND transporter permease subunit n=1 Tax=Fodinicurvata sp. EGI_FJ10296 TaxID=3231908 RepID=UPI003452E79A